MPDEMPSSFANSFWVRPDCLYLVSNDLYFVIILLLTTKLEADEQIGYMRLLGWIPSINLNGHSATNKRMGTITRDRPTILTAAEVHPILFSYFHLLVINICLLAQQKKKVAKKKI